MDFFAVSELGKHLHTNLLGRNTIVFDSLDSTNTEARRMLETGCADGTVIIADRQTGGRGRRGRRWISEAGCGLWMTVIFKPIVPVEELQKLTLLAGLAVCRAVGQVTDKAIKPVIKWPNDVLVSGGKLCGILCESAVDSAGQRWAIAGIGINTGKPEAGYGEAEGVAISLAQAAGKTVGRMALAAALLNEMEALLDGWQIDGFAAIAAGYRQYMLPVGSDAVVIDGDRRRPCSIAGLDDGGGLLVRLDTGEVERIISGEIAVRGVDGNV